MPRAQLFPRPVPSRWPQQAVRVPRIAARAGRCPQGLKLSEAVPGPAVGGSV